MKTEREKNLEAAEWMARDGRMYRERDASAIGLWTKEAEMCERAAVALRKLVELEDESSVSTSLPVALFGVRTWLPSSVAERVVEACKENGNGD